MQLYIGNKNYSSWSMRPWVLMRQAGIAFDEVMVRMDHYGPPAGGQGTQFRERMGQVSPVGKVPVLVDDDGTTVWDTLAIAEYLAERFPEKASWPAERAARARARSLCAEMHSGFGGLRSACAMNIEASLPEVGQRIMAEQPAAVADLARITSMWTEALAASGGPFLFGAFGIVDAYYAPVASRIRTYALPVPPQVAAYIDRLWATDGVQAWQADALLEQDFLPGDEPYRSAR